MDVEQLVRARQPANDQPSPRTAAGRPLPLTTPDAGEWTEEILFWVLVAGLAWAPFYLGANALVAWGINAVLFPALAVAYEGSLLARGRGHPVGLRHIGLPAAFFFAVVIWVFLQQVTWMPGRLQNPLWSMTADVLGRPVAGSISVNRDLTALSLLNLISCGAVFWLALQLGRDAQRGNRLLGAIAAVGVAYAVYGLIAFVATPGYTLWFQNPIASGSVTSTFFNKNSYGAYAGTALCVLTGLTLSHYRQQAATAGVPFKYRLATFLETTGGRAAALLAGLFVLLVSLLMTASRGAIISTAFALVLIVALGSRSQRRGREQRLTVFIGVLLLAATFIGFGDQFLDRLGDSGIADTARLAVAKTTIDSTMSSPLLGYGFGSFADVFPMFRDQSVSIAVRWVMAHNTYLEALQGLGVVFGALIIAAVAMLSLKCLKGATTRRANLTPSRVAAGVSLLLGVHSLVDFSLQIQAIALTFAAILGVGLAQSDSSRADTSD